MTIDPLTFGNSYEHTPINLLLWLLPKRPWYNCLL